MSVIEFNLNPVSEAVLWSSGENPQIKGCFMGFIAGVHITVHVSVTKQYSVQKQYSLIGKSISMSIKLMLHI